MVVFRIAGTVADTALRPARGAWKYAGRAERSARHRLVDRGGRVTLVCVDAALASPYANEVVHRIVDSDLAERAMERALSGQLVDVVAADLVRFRVVERVVDNVFVRAALDRALDRLDDAEVPRQLADRVLASGVVERLVERVLDGPELERIVERALESPGAERLVSGALATPGAERLLAVALESPGAERMIGRVVESRVVEEASLRIAEDVVSRLRASPALWTLIDEIAQSPAVLDAIAQQSAGFADQVGDELRERTRHADDRLERAAWRLFRRHPAGGAPPTPGVA